MFKHIIPFIMLCLSVPHAHAQEITYSFEGNVSDQNGAHVAFASVLLSKDDAIISGVSTDEEGYFRFNKLAQGAYKIEISYVGYNTVIHEIEITKNTTFQFSLTEDATLLEAVTVHSQLPKVQKLADRTVFTVANTSLANGSMWNVLQKTPQVLVLNNTIQVKGEQPTIYINNKKVYLSASEVQQLLENSSAATVQSIEVITNPSAKYDAEDAVVININLSKNIATGYNGSVQGSYTQGIYPKYSIGVNQYYKTDKWNIYASYAYNPKKINRYTNENIEFLEAGNSLGNWNTEIDRDTWSENHLATTTIDYQLNKKSSLSFSAQGNFTPYWKRNTAANTIASSTVGVVDSTFSSFNRTQDKTNNLAMNLGYNLSFKKPGESLTILTHYTYYNAKRDQDVATAYFAANGGLLNTNQFITNQEQDINIFTAQADYTLPLKNELSLDFGSKFTTIDTQNDLFQNSENATLNQNGDFTYNEDNFAVYTNASKSWNKWSLQAGLRAENTNANGLGSNTNNSFKYLKWFPSGSLSYTPSAHHNFSAYYRKSIIRPGYERLNPFRYYLSDNSYVAGNPNLLPTIKQYMSLDYTFKGTYTFALFYKHEKNPFGELSIQDNQEKNIAYLANNLEEGSSYGLDFNISKSLTNRWFLYLETTTFYNKLQFFDTEQTNRIVDNNRWTGWYFVGNYFTLLKDYSLTADVTYMYVLPANDANAEVTARNYLNIGLNKTLWDGRASISLQANDIFNGQIFTSTTNYLNQNNSYRSRFENRTVMLGFKYKFGNYRLNTNQKAIDIEERERL